MFSRFKDLKIRMNRKSYRYKFSSGCFVVYIKSVFWKVETLIILCFLKNLNLKKKLPIKNNFRGRLIILVNAFLVSNFRVFHKKMSVRKYSVNNVLHQQKTDWLAYLFGVHGYQNKFSGVPYTSVQILRFLG